MAIDNYMLSTGDSDYYNPDFRRMIEDHLVTMRNDSNLSVVDVQPEQVYKFNGNFYQMLVDLGITDMSMHWIIMRVTGIKDPTDPIDNLKQILIPNSATIRQLMSVFKQTGTKIS